MYRALVRARWDDAVAAGQPALVVHAGAMSRPILERLGFQACRGAGSAARSRDVLSAELREFARSPGAYLDPSGAEMVDDERYFAAIVAGGKYINVFRPRFAARRRAEVLAEVRALAPSRSGRGRPTRPRSPRRSSPPGARPPGAAARLGVHGARDRDGAARRRRLRDPPHREFDDYLVGLEIALSAEQYTDEARAHRRAEAEDDVRAAQVGPVDGVARVDRRRARRARARLSRPARACCSTAARRCRAHAAAAPIAR